MQTVVYSKQTAKDTKKIEQANLTESSIIANTAIRFSKFFGTTAEFRLNLQNLYDLEEENNNHSLEFETIKMYAYA